MGIQTYFSSNLETGTTTGEVPEMTGTRFSLRTVSFVEQQW